MLGSHVAAFGELAALIALAAAALGTESQRVAAERARDALAQQLEGLRGKVLFV